MAPRLLQCLADLRLQALLNPTLVILEVPKRAEVCEERRLGVRSGLLRYLQIADQGFLAGNEASGLGDTFTDGSTGPLVCQTANGGSIDPNPFLDPVSGRLYLVWKSDDNSIGKNTHLWAQQLTADGSSFAPGTAPALLLTESAGWQSPTVEGPTIIRHGSTYYLFYGANSYNSASSGIGYATSSSLLGNYTNDSRYGPWLGTTGSAVGPQGPMVFQDAAGSTRMAFAAWYGPVGYGNGGMRALWIGTLQFNRFGPPSIS